MKTIANKTALNTRNNATVHVIDADEYSPEVLVAKTKEDAEYAWLQEEREIVWLREE